MSDEVVYNLSLGQAAQMLRVSYSTLRKAVTEHNGVILSDSKGRPLLTAVNTRPDAHKSRWRVSQDQLEDALDSQRFAPTEERKMPLSDNPIRATLSVGMITCSVRSPEPLTGEQWQVVSELAQQVRDANDRLMKANDG